MIFYRKLLVGEKIGDAEAAKQALKDAGRTPKCWVLLYVPDPENAHPVEICPGFMIRQPYYLNNRPYILGIAADKEEATELLRQLVEDAVRSTGRPDIRSFLFPHGIKTVLAGEEDPEASV